MTIYEQILDLLKDKIGCIVLSSELKKELNEKYGTNTSSIILSDYCYNRYNDGIKFNKHIFQYINRNSYKFLSENYPFTGLIFHKPKKQKDEVIIGEWKNGIKIINAKSIGNKKTESKRKNKIDIINKQEFQSKANYVKIQIEKDFETLNEFELEKFFEKFNEDRRTLSFLEYYNRTVLDNEKINFGEFKRQWAIQGMTRHAFNFFSNNFRMLKEEIQKEKDIKKFFERYCCTVRREASFCSKLFHTILPDEFPPLDNPIKKKFNLQKEEFVKSVLIIKLGYKMFFEENPNKIDLIRKLLSKSKFTYLMINELSDIRILDMYYWFKENREN